MDLLDRGEGPALLLLHGFPLDRRIWEAQGEPLAERFRVLAPDLPGFGRSAGLPLPGSLEEAAGSLLGLLDSLGVDRFAAAGHSMGGYLVFALYRAAPARITGMGLVATRAAADSPEARRAREETALRALREGPGFLAESMPARQTSEGAPPDLLDRLRPIMRGATGEGVAAWSRAMAARPDATPDLERISVPTVVVAGRRDKIVPAAESEAMGRAIPGARMVWCERSGHLPMMEEPDRVTEALRGLGA